MPSALFPALAQPSVPRPRVASPVMAAPEDPKRWVLLMLRMRLRLGAGEPWQPSKDGGCHGNGRHSIRSQLWARDAPGGVGGRTGVPLGLGDAKASAQCLGKPPSSEGSPWPAVPGGDRQVRLAGSRPCTWPCHSPVVPTATITSGYSQAVPMGHSASAHTLCPGE